MTVLCLIETDAGGAVDSSLRALTFARRLAVSAGEELAAAWFDSGANIDHGKISAAGVAAGVVKAYAIGSGAAYAPLAWARGLAGLASALPASAVVAASTDRGNELLAHLGAITGLPMAANCVQASRTSPDQYALVRQRWAGSLLEDSVLTGTLALLTVATDALAAALPEALAPDALAPASPDAATAPAATEPRPLVVEAYQPELQDGDLLVRATESAQRQTGVSLATARVVVGGGRGVGGPEGFASLEELAGLLGAAVGVSRVVTSQGWRPHQQQVGQTGTRIAPELYLACGISGAIQHMAGCQSAKTIVAVNTDTNSPIVARADYAVIGDLHQVIPALVAALRARAEPPPS
jgi:electron transfer flavoprotein alpha subunit